MTNKKEEESEGLSLFATIAIIMLLIVIAVGIFWYVTRGILEPHFAIYKKECRNETITNEFCLESRVYESISLMKSIGYYSKLIDECKAHNCDSLKEFQDKLDKVLEESDIFLNQFNPCSVEEEICEQVEVEEIKIYCKENCIDRETFEEAHNCLIESGCESFWTILSKQYLTISWLDENCGLPYDYKLDDERYDENVNYYYDCGKYTVGVVK